MKKFFKWMVLVAVLVAMYFILPPHVQMATRHWFANIDDYLLFSNDTLHTDLPKPLLKADQYQQIVPSEDKMAFLKKRKTGAFVVLKEGKVVYEYYAEGLNEETISGSFSMAKSVISLLIGKAIEEGYITSVHQPVKDFLPDYAFAADTLLTLQSLLTMSAAFDWNEMYINPFSLTTKSYYGNDLEGLMHELKLKGEPGKIWQYQSISTQVLAEVLIQATGQSITRYATTKLWQPLGMTHHALWSTDHEQGKEKAFCCLSATALDYARLGQLVLQNGRWDSVQLIPADYIREATAPANYLSLKNGKPVQHYGYQFWIMRHAGLTVPYFCGHLGQFIFVLPEKNAVVVRLGHNIKESFDESDQYKDGYTFLETGLEILRQLEKP